MNEILKGLDLILSKGRANPNAENKQMREIMELKDIERAKQSNEIKLLKEKLSNVKVDMQLI